MNGTAETFPGTSKPSDAYIVENTINPMFNTIDGPPHERQNNTGDTWNQDVKVPRTGSKTRAKLARKRFNSNKNKSSG